MRTPEDPRAEEIQILPVVVVVRAFAARPSSVPHIRDFVRARVPRNLLSDDDIRTLGQRVSEVLLDAAGTNGSIQVSLRTFPDRAEVDVLHAEHDGRAGGAAAISGGSGSTAGPGPGPVTQPGPADKLGPTEPTSRPSATDRAAGTTFARWLADALRREGMTMEAAARRLSVSVKTVSRWVSGTTEPRLRDLSRMRQIFGELPFP